MKDRIVVYNDNEPMVMSIDNMKTMAKEVEVPSNHGRKTIIKRLAENMEGK